MADSVIARLTYANFVSAGNDNLIEKLNHYDPNFTYRDIKKISLTVDADCVIKVNGDEVLVKPQFGFEIDKEDYIINSLEIVGVGISVYAIVGY